MVVESLGVSGLGEGARGREGDGQELGTWAVWVKQRHEECMKMRACG